jgi:hypothetical protein
MGSIEFPIEHIREEEDRACTQTNTTSQYYNGDKVLSTPVNKNRQSTHDSNNKPPIQDQEITIIQKKGFTNTYKIKLNVIISYSHYCGATSNGITARACIYHVNTIAPFTT